MAGNEFVKPLLSDLRLWGFSNFLLLYGLLSLCSGSVSSAFPSEQLVLVDVFPSGYFLPMLVIFAVSCLVPGRFSKHFSLLTTTLFLVGMGALMVGLILDSMGTWLLVAVLTPFAIGLAFAAAAWLRILSGDTLRSGVVIVVVSQGISALAQVPLLPSLPLVVIGTMTVASVLLNGFLLHMCKRRIAAGLIRFEVVAAKAAPAGFIAASNTAWQRLKLLLEYLKIPLLCVIAIALMLAFIRTVTTHSLGALAWGYHVPAVGRLLASLLLVVVWVLMKKPLRTNLMILGVFLVALVEVALFPLFGLRFPTAFLIFGHTLMTIAFIVALAACLEAVQSSSMPTLPLVSAVFAAMYSSLTLGILIVRQTYGEGGIDPASLLLQAFVVVIILALALVIMNATTGTFDTSTRQKEVQITPVIGLSESELRANPILTGTFNLSKREMDVLVLLAGARNVSYIADALFISENTVRCHMKTIYQKLDVHSKQQLITLIAKVASDRQLSG
ncbi:MAG: helix-turn-helix transcriptional regulator [Coriobacteriales bacterium]|jgi:DNA-binding CsgD family transcriptional regulator|nr:helix-turn-helix transcriptional regulator [Coriobacteriales bacterium]